MEPWNQSIRQMRLNPDPPGRHMILPNLDFPITEHGEDLHLEVEMDNWKRMDEKIRAMGFHFESRQNQMEMGFDLSDSDDDQKATMKNTVHKGYPEPPRSESMRDPELQKIFSDLLKGDHM